MKRTILFALSICLITGIGFAQNIKTSDKSKSSQRPGEMMIKNQSAADELKKELELKHMTLEEYEDYAFEKSNKYFKEKYPQFANTCPDAEALIKKELFKNPNWKIKEIIFRGQNPLITSEAHYLVKSTSGEKEIVCYGRGRDYMNNAIYMWKNPQDFNSCRTIIKAKKDIARDALAYTKGFLGTDKTNVGKNIEVSFNSTKRVCSYNLSYCQPKEEYEQKLFKKVPLYPFQKCDGKYYPIKDMVMQLEEINDSKSYHFLNLASCTENPKMIYYSSNPKTATADTIVKEVPMQFNYLKTFDMSTTYLAGTDVKCHKMPVEVFACADRLKHF